MPTSLGPLRIKTGTPSNPPSGEVALYSADGTALLFRDSSGNVTTLGGGTKVSALNAAGALAGTESVPVVQGGTTVRTTTSAIAALASAGAGDMTLAGAQTVTGVKIFSDNTLLMRGSDGTTTAEPYSDVNPPETLTFTDYPAGSVVTPAAGFSTVFTSDGRVLYIKDNDGTARPIDMSWENCPFSSVGALTVKVGANRYPVKGGTFQIQTIAAMVGTAPTGSSAILDVNKNGTTIYGTQGNRPTIAVSTTSATVGAHTATTVTDGDYITVDIDQIGSTVAGSDLTVVVRMQRIA